MPPKPGVGIFGQIREQMAELGKKTVKSTVKEVANVVSPVNIAESLIKPGGAVTSPENNMQTPNSTPLDMNKVGMKQREQSQKAKDEAELAAIRRQFNIQNQEQQGARSSLQKEAQHRQEADAAEARQKQQQLQQAQAAPAEDSPGKRKGKLGQARQKAKVPDRKPGDGKH